MQELVLLTGPSMIFISGMKRAIIDLNIDNDTITDVQLSALHQILRSPCCYRARYLYLVWHLSFIIRDIRKIGHISKDPAQ